MVSYLFSTFGQHFPNHFYFGFDHCFEQQLVVFFNNLWQKERCVSNFSTLRLVPCLCSAAIIVFFSEGGVYIPFFLLPDQAISASCAVLIAHGCDSVR